MNAVFRIVNKNDQKITVSTTDGTTTETRTYSLKNLRFVDD